MITQMTACSLRKRHTFALDVSCRRLIEYDGANDLPQVLDMLQPGEKWFHLGGGSNILPTGDFDGTILVNRACNTTFLPQGNATYPPGTVFADAGATLDNVIAEACRLDLWGIENLSGIPGTIGGAAVQNVGAYGQEFGDVVAQLLVYDITGRCMTIISGQDCNYGYRHSIFKEDGVARRYIILNAMLILSTHPQPKLDYGNLRAVVGDTTPLTPGVMRQAVLTTRSEKLPDISDTGSAGSFFKNPVLTPDEFKAFQTRIGNDSFPRYNLPDGSVKIPAAWLIDNTGWKGVSVGNAAVWHKQPLVLVNATGNATPSEILELEQRIIKSVNEKFGIILTPEVIHL